MAWSAEGEQRGGRDAGGTTDPRINVALARGLALLGAFGQGEMYLANAELARRTGIPKATVSRLTHTLCAFGYLSYDPDIGKYAIAPGILALGYNVLAHHPIHLVARGLMERLADETKSVIGLGVRDGLHMTFLEYAKGNSAVTRNTSVGFRVSIGHSAMGWAGLAAMRAQDRDATLAQLRSTVGERAWPDLHARIERRIREVWEHGYCVSYGDVDPLVNAVAVPLLQDRLDTVYAVNCMAPAYLLGKERIVEDIGPRLLRLVDELRRRMADSAG